MIFFFDSDGNLFRSVPETVYQGSNNHNKIYVIAPFAQSSAVSVAFKLPNGTNTVSSLCTLTPATGELADYIDKNTNESLFVWALNIPAWVTDYAGNVTVQFFITASGSTLATSSVQFTVLQGVSHAVPSNGDLQSVIAAFSNLLAEWQQYKNDLETAVNNIYLENKIVAVVQVETGGGYALYVPNNFNPAWIVSIDWGDGTVNTDYVHAYTAAGIYVIKISVAQVWSSMFSDSANRNKLLKVYFNNFNVPTRCFENCQNLQVAHLADDITSIGLQAFKGCTSLSSITLPKNLSQLGGLTFQGCTALKTAELYNLIQTAGSQIFSDCESLKKVYFHGFKSEFNFSNGIFDGISSAPTVYYLSEGKETDNENEINTIKTYIPTGTSAANKLVNENDIDNAVSQAMENAHFVSTDKTTPQSVAGDFTVGGNAVIVGNLTVEGTEYINDVETIQSENTLIITNYSEEGAALTTLSGVVAITGEKENDEYPAIAVAVYDPADQTLKLGTGTYADGEFTPDNPLQPLATRSSNIANGNLLKWDNINHTIVDAGVAISAADKAAWNAKQDALTFDNTPTSGSTNPVTSGGVYTALDGKVDTTSLAFRIYGTDSNGNQVVDGLPYAYALINNSIAVRRADGQLYVGTPVDDEAATPKKYVDDNLPVIRDWTV